jgi:cytochrome c oxidase subunit 2
MAGRVDQLFLFLVGASGLITLGITLALLTFAIKYRRRPGNLVARRVGGTVPIEIAWTLIPLGLAMVPFTWGAKLYLDLAKPPDDALEISVVARQWMWKVQHPDGQSEIDELHVPVGRPVKLTMISQDVIHSFFVPEFRVKADVLPGRYTTAWFEATRPGEYHLFCTEYCGTDHSRMIGRVVALPPAEFEAWLRGGSATVPAGEASPAPTGEALPTPTGAGPPAQAGAGRELFEQYGCVACHETNLAPSLAGVFGQPVRLTDGTTVTADENYLRESILNPSAKVVEGYQPIMPTFAGQLDDEQLLRLIAYIKSIGNRPGSPPGSPAPSPTPTAAGAP